VNTYLFVIHFYNVRFSLLNENAEKTDMEFIFVRNNKQHSDIEITKTKKFRKFLTTEIE